MLEQKLIVGRYFDLNINPPPPTVVPPIGSFLHVNALDCYLQESAGVFTKVSTVAVGQGPKARRNFRFLPWLPGLISEVALVGSDVLTGPMSGCWLVTYRKPNGVPHAAHLGTDVASQQRTDAVNTAWNAFATGHPGDVIGGFNPTRHWNGNFPAAEAGDVTNRVLFGLDTTNNEFYAMLTYQQVARTTTLRIAGIQRIASVPVARLQHVDLPGP